MGIFDIFKKKKSIQNNQIEINNSVNVEKVEEIKEKIDFIDGKIMNITENGVIDTNSYKAIEIYKHNLEVLVNEALEKGHVDKFFIIREDDFFPVNFEWNITSADTNFEKTNLPISSEIRKEIVIERKGLNREVNGMILPISQDEIIEGMKDIDKEFGNVYLPSHFRSTKHFTVNTPLEVTGNYNTVTMERDFIIIDNIKNFLEFGYGYTLAFRDAYLDVSHEALKISDEGIVLINEDKYERIISDDDIKKELEGKKVILYRGDTCLAIDMLLTELGAIPSNISQNYLKHDNRIYDILNNSLENLAKQNNLEYDRGHFGTNGHFTSYYDDKNKEFNIYLDQFCNFLKQKFPEYQELFVPNIFTNDVKEYSPMQYEVTRKRTYEIVRKVGAENLANAINEFNEIMKAKEKENNASLMEKRKTITEEMSNLFKKTTKLISYYFDNKNLFNFDNDMLNKIDESILIFLHNDDPNIQYEAAKFLNLIISQDYMIHEETTNEFIEQDDINYKRGSLSSSVGETKN